MSSPEETKPLDPEEGVAGESDKDKKEKKRLKKLQRALEEARRPLGAWERYRALIDAFDMEQDLVDLADHKARFALIIMSTLNAVTFIVGTRSEAIALVPPHLRASLSMYLGLYALLTLYFSIQAIESLRPREAKPNVRYPGAIGLEDYPLGVRFFVDVLARDVNAYRSVWRSIHVGQLNAEIALQVHALAKINRAKYGALGRLYRGLKAMTVLTAGLIMAIAALGLGPPEAARTPALVATAYKNKAEAVQLLGEPARFTVVGALEPSGLVFDRPSGHLFVVGDEGTLSEVSGDGQAVSSQAGLSNLEDVAFHDPSGNLVLLSEKKARLILFDPVTKTEIRKFRLDKGGLLGEEAGEPNQGFEGLAFREDAKHEGGGVFYMTHQRSPSLVVAVAFDLREHERTIGAADVIARFKLPGFRDLTAITYVPQLDRLLVVADYRDRILVLKLDGSLEEEIALPGLKQEGIALDQQGRLWIADERAGLLRFDGALSAIKSHLGAISAPAVPAGR